jgi:adenosylhomocysteine nucleosidase
LVAAVASNTISDDAGENLRIHQGQIISGDAFIWERNYTDYVGKFPNALATDMETAAIGQVAYQFGVPWVSVRAISDLCGPSAAGDFKTHIDDAAAISAQTVIAMLPNIA